VLAGTDDKELLAGLPVPEPLKGAMASSSSNTSSDGTGSNEGAQAPVLPPGGGFAFLEKELRLAPGPGGAPPPVGPGPGAGPGAGGPPGGMMEGKSGAGLHGGHMPMAG
jgi:hypothetical protein